RRACPGSRAEGRDSVCGCSRRCRWVHSLDRRAAAARCARRHCQLGKGLRILTTTYTNSTEQRALDELAALGAEIKVSYDTSAMRLHAKAWIIHRASGYSTAYIGSSNLSHSALVAGLEWNVRLSGVRNPDAV